MCDMDFSAEDDMLGEFDNIEEIMTKIDPYFLDEFMKDFTKENTSENSLILGAASDNTLSINSLLCDDVENKTLLDNTFPKTNNFNITTKDPVLQSFQPAIQTDFVKSEPITPPSQPAAVRSKAKVDNKKNTANFKAISQPAILISTSNFCNIKPATERNQNGTQYQNIKPIAVQNNFSVMPQVVSLQGLSNDNSIFVQTPTVMYTKADVQPVNTMTHRQGIKQFPSAKTLVFVEADSKVPIHRVSVKGGRVGKRLAHNATEKKYRLSISSGIESLKNLVVGDDAKLQKSAILRKAVDFIHLLQKQNRELQRQNIELMKAANISNVKDLLLPSSDHKFDYYGTLTPPRSDVSNSSLSPSYSDHSPVSSPYSSRDESDDNEMTTNSGPQERVIMCVCMLAVLIFNPFGNFLSKFYDESDTHSGTTRNILSSNNEYNFPWFNFGLQLTVWIINCIILSIGLVRLLIYGDPVLSFKSKISEEFYKHSRHAETEFGKGNGFPAYRELNRCLQSYGIFLPTTKRECFTATLWQLIRMILNIFWIGRFLSRKAGGLFCTNEKRIQSLNSAKELALVFHRLNQIHLTMNMKDSHGLFMSLYAVNMAEVASNVMSPALKLEIYMTAALRVKESYPKFLQIFSRLYLNKAKQQSSILGNRIPIEFQWVFTPYGYRYFVNHSFVYNSNLLNNESMFSRLGNKSDPMSYVMREYYEHLLERALQSLVGTGQLKNSYTEINNNNDDKENGTRMNDVLYYTQLLMDSINVDSAVDFNCRDKLAHWWANIFGIAKYWILGEIKSAEELYSYINILPHELQYGTDSLPKAFFYAFQVKRAIRNKNGLNTDEVYSYCLKGSNLLTESINGNKCRSVNGMKVLVQFLTCNWLLESRHILWELEYTDEQGNYMSVPGKVMSEFQRDLNSLKIIAENISNAESRVNVYEAIYRLMAGAAPGPTQELLNRNMSNRNYRSSMICGKERNHDWEGGEREKADAIFIANKHLPTNLFSDSRIRRGHLMEAINIFEKIGDKNRLDECNKLLSSIGSSASN